MFPVAQRPGICHRRLLYGLTQPLAYSDNSPQPLSWGLSKSTNSDGKQASAAQLATRSLFRLGAGVVILEAHDVVFAQVFPVLHFNQNQRNHPRIF
jgi:hypothetical protein